MSRQGDTRRFPDSWVQVCLGPLPRSHQGRTWVCTTLNPPEREQRKVQHPPRHSSSRHSGAKNSSWVTAYSHCAAEKQYLSWPHFPYLAAGSQNPNMSYGRWRHNPTYLHPFFQFFLYLLIFNTRFPWKPLSRNLINPSIPQSLSLLAKMPPSYASL